MHIKRPIREGRSFRLVDSVLPVKEILANGAPVYDWGQLRDEVPLQAPDLRGGDGWKTVRDYMLPMPVETADAFYSLVVPENDQKLKLPGIDGDTWWASRNWRTKLVRFDKQTGRPLWAVGRRAPGRAEPGQMYYPACLSGAAGDFLFVLDTMGMVWVWHNDGLYLGRLYHDTASDNGRPVDLLRDPGLLDLSRSRTGQALFAGRRYRHHLHEIVLPKVERLTGEPVTVTAQQAAQASPWDPDGVAPTQRPACDVYFTAQPPKIEGGLEGLVVAITRRSAPAGDARLAGRPAAGLGAGDVRPEESLPGLRRPRCGGTAEPRQRIAVLPVRERRLRRFLPGPRLVRRSARRCAKATCGSSGPPFRRGGRAGFPAGLLAAEEPGERTRRPSPRRRRASISIRSGKCRD